MPLVVHVWHETGAVQPEGCGESLRDISGSCMKVEGKGGTCCFSCSNYQTAWWDSPGACEKNMKPNKQREVLFCLSGLWVHVQNTLGIFAFSAFALEEAGMIWRDTADLVATAFHWLQVHSVKTLGRPFKTPEGKPQLHWDPKIFSPLISVSSSLGTSVSLIVKWRYEWSLEVCVGLFVCCWYSCDLGIDS